MSAQDASAPAGALSEVELAILQKWANPAEASLSEMEWYALQSIIQRRTADGSSPPIDMLKTAKAQSQLFPLCGLDMVAWFEWRVAHPCRRAEPSLATAGPPTVPPQESSRAKRERDSKSPHQAASAKVARPSLPSSAGIPRPQINKPAVLRPGTTGTTGNPLGGGGVNLSASNGTADTGFRAWVEKESVTGQNAHYQTITSQQAYRGFSTEELRLQDYARGRR
ncbi:hypothetical protein SLS58_000553 [Diplodia intermedia]|uniref:Uncharacterized protein n=1 Tax=Diplodia intermedia TaxID=856260 RepID=A0ABR3U4J6_9PEZI